VPRWTLSPAQLNSNLTNFHLCSLISDIQETLGSCPHRVLSLELARAHFKCGAHVFSRAFVGENNKLLHMFVQFIVVKGV